MIQGIYYMQKPRISFDTVYTTSLLSKLWQLSYKEDNVCYYLPCNLVHMYKYKPTNFFPGDHFLTAFGAIY